MDMNRHLAYWMALAAFLAAVPPMLLADPSETRNPPSECKAPDSGCGCSDDEEGDDEQGASSEGSEGVEDVCIKVNLPLGRTTPWTGSMRCRLKVFADNDSPDVFTPDSLYASIGGYTFKRVGSKVLSDGATPAEVVLSHPNGEPIRFVFADGESMGRPDPGFHVKMDERLQMTDAEGWATVSEPVYYDLYVGDGTVRRFLATDMTGQRGKLVSVTDARGLAVTPADMGVDVVYGADGVRQFLTPSRLADVAAREDGYDVTVYPIQDVPARDAATGLYAPPAVTPVRRLSVRRANGGRRAVVTLRRGGGAARTHVFDYARGDWSLTRPSGVQEVKDRMVEDSKAARTVKEVRSATGERLSRRELNYVWESWGFAATNRVEGFGGVTETTTWTYCRTGGGKGQVATELRQSGLLSEYAYDSLGRKVSETRSGPGMMTDRTIWDYTPVDPSDAVLPVDTRPRTVVKTLDGVECERTYYVYSPLTNIVERVGTQGAAYGGTNALRTVTAFYPVTGGPRVSRPNDGLVQSVRYEDGRLDLYDYVLASNLWTETVTHLHELSPAPVDGRTTRDVKVLDARGKVVEARTEALVDGMWHTIARDRRTYNLEGKVVRSENLAGQVTTTEWDCCHKVSETNPDGSATTWDYDGEGRMVAVSRLIPIDMTNVTWLTTCYEYDGLGRQVATWQTNYAVQVGLPVERTTYDAIGRVVSRSDTLGNVTTTSYSPDGRTVSVQNPNTSTRIMVRNAARKTVSVTGTAVTPEFTAYGILPNGIRWTRTVQGETADSARFTKRYENMLGQVVCTERSGCNDSVLTTLNTYSSFGQLIRTDSDGEPVVEYLYDTLGRRTAIIRSADGEWRRTDALSSYVRVDGAMWQIRSNVVSCSDSVIAPQITSASVQLSGLTVSNPVRTVTTDVRGNATESWRQTYASLIADLQRIPTASNVSGSWTRYGILVREVSVSAVTNTYAYDALGRQVAKTDGRGNTARMEYDAAGRQSATFDGADNRTSYAYDQFGDLAAVTDPLDNAIIYEYDLRGRKTYEGGATYPVRYAYDVFGNKTSMTTYRDESSGSGDVTVWLYDEASGVMTNKVYADGMGPRYAYTANGALATRTWARGVVTSYAYDGWGNLTNTTYSDGTPTVSMQYDAMGRQVEVHDAAGVTTFAYDAFGSLTNEMVVGVAGTNVIERYWDGYGRSLGYSLNGERRTTLSYEPDTGRITSMLAAGSTNLFRWTYLPGTDLKETLTYPNGDVVRWEYEPQRDLLTLVSNATHSVYSYTYDAAGRRVSKNDERYGYNVRDELTLATNVVDGIVFAYVYDDIGNRLWSREFGTNCTYAANELNQYTEIVRGGVAEHPAFDADGNQTDIVTGTGRWLVEYNGENRPVRWTRPADGTILEMSYDNRGRRVHFNADTFVYDDYLNIGTTVWDPTEPVATRPLVWLAGGSPAYYFHDGNKNVSDVVSCSGSVRYAYTPFGQSALLGLLPCKNQGWFSSEIYDDILGLLYFNYRHYDITAGHWMNNDPIAVIALVDRVLDESLEPKNPYVFLNNGVTMSFDYIGLACGSSWNDWFVPDQPDGFDFSGPCEGHDACYSDCERYKDECDSSFLREMLEECDRHSTVKYVWRRHRHHVMRRKSNPRSKCIGWAKTYYKAVVDFGQGAYDDAQAESGCCKNGE